MSAPTSAHISGPFKYRHLDPDRAEIRLLHIEHNVDETKPIRVTIKHVVVNEELNFTALSYTWGPTSLSHDIHIFGDGAADGVFGVRQNLHDFLYKMQREETDDWLWIDQICINQDDQQEKSQQVCRMADLYGKARKVLIWLGTSFEGSNDLMDFIPTVVGDGEKCVSDSVQAYLLQCLRTEDTEGFQRDDDEPTEPNGDDRINKFGDYRHGPDAEMNRLRSLDNNKTHQTAYRARVEEFRTKYGLACQRLAGLSYFRRVWVIQEITLSSNRVIRIGSKSASWEDVTRFLDYVCNPDNRAIDSFKSWNIKRITYLGNIWECGLGSDTASANEQQECGWYSVLSFVLTSQCTDMRDKAFSMLGLLPKRLHIYPEYGLEGHEVVCQLMRKQIADRLALLNRTYSENHRKSFQLGSWECREFTMMNVVEALMAAVATSVWYYEMHRGEQQG